MAPIVSMLLLLTMPLCITSQSGFGRPWSSVSALDELYDAGRHSDRYRVRRYGLASGFYSSFGYDDEYDDHYDDYFGQRAKAEPQGRPTQRYGERSADSGRHPDVNVPQHSPQTANPDARGHSAGSTSLAQPALQAPHWISTAALAGGTMANTAALSRASSESNSAIPVLQEHAPVASQTPRAALPSSEGIEVEDADFPWPEKNDDASEGWFDNRGDFQYY